MTQRLRTTTIALASAALWSVCLAAQGAKPADKPADVAGKWNMDLQLSFGPASPTIVLKQDEMKLTGTYTGRYGDAPVTGTIKGRAIQFMVKINAEGQEAEMDFTGEVAGDSQSMKGALQITGLDDATWSATRAKAPAPRP